MEQDQDYGIGMKLYIYQMIDEIMHLNSFLVDYNKILHCVYEVSLEELRKFSTGFLGMATRMEDIEWNNRVQGKEFEDI